MATLSSNNLFQSWELSRQEYLTGSIFTNLQIQCIQNQVAQAMQQKTLLKFNPDNIIAYAQQEAELQGQIIALQFLLSTSEEAARELDPGLESRVNITPRETPPEESGSLFPPLLASTSVDSTPDLFN